MFLSFFASHLSAQCNVQTNERDDGVKVRFIRPDRVGLCDRFVLGLSMQTNGKQFFVVTLSVFETDAVRLQGKLTLFFENNKSSTFELYRSEITTVKGSPATISIFIANENGLANISNSDIKMAVVQLEDNTYQTISVKINADILKKQYNCLK